MTDFQPEGTKPATTESTEPSPRAAQVQASRRRRQDTGPTAGLKLHVHEDAKDPNFEYRFINDTTNRIHEKTVRDDWDIVKTDQMNGFGTAEETSEGTQVARHVGGSANGAPRRAYLCRKPKEFYDADKAKEQAAITEREKSIRRGDAQTPEGLSGPTSYVPNGSNQITRGR